MELRQTTDCATETELIGHLTACDTSYRPKLSDRVDVRVYGKKLMDNARRFEIWDGATLAGLAAVYFNDTENRRGYISNVSVLPEYTGNGIGMQLMACVEAFAIGNGFEELRLETGIDNPVAIQLYEKCGFRHGEETAGMIHYRKRLGNHE